MAVYRRLVLILLLTAGGAAQAASVNQIANLCQERWPAQKGMQAFCIKINREYHDWMQYIRKRVFSDRELLGAITACERKYAPDYRRAMDCYWDEVE